MSRLSVCINFGILGIAELARWKIKILTLNSRKFGRTIEYVADFISRNGFGHISPFVAITTGPGSTI